MGPRKGKNVTGENDWRACIEEAVLNDETWNAKIIIIEAAGSDQDRIYLSKFELFAAEEKRFVIKNICKTETIFMVNQLGGEKKVKDDQLRVFEEGQAYLKDKKDIPPDIQALIIKHLILKMKEEYIFIKMHRLEVKKGMRKESATMIDRAEVRGTVNVKSPEPSEPNLPSPKGKGKKNGPDVSSFLLPEPIEGKKYNTLLRVRGEEWRDKVYVDDFPIDGPNIYVAVTGFVEPYLPTCLMKIGIPLTAIVQIRIDPISTKVPSTLFRATKRGQSQTEILTEKSLQFWEDLQSLRIHIDSTNDFKNTAFVVFTPPYLDTDNLSGNPDKIYDELCFLMYDLQDLTRQHVHYLENMNIIKIPEEKEDGRLKQYYNEQIDDLPLECVSTYSVLDSILQVVCKNDQVDKHSSRSSLSTSKLLDQPHKSNIKIDDKIEKAETLVKHVFNTLCKTDTNQKSYRISYGEEYESHNDPIIINYGDSAKYTTFHLKNINLKNIIWSTLIGMPINKLWQNQDRPHGELEAKINFHVNVLLSCFDREDVETTELNRLVHILACRKLYNNRSSLKKQHLPSSTISDFKKVYLKRSVLAEPLPACPSLQRSSSNVMPSFPTMTKSENISRVSSAEDPEVQRIKFLFDCPDISELVSAAEIANGKPINHMIDDFEFFEDFTGISALQIMLEAFDKFNCVDYKHCEVTDCFILMFYNSYDQDGIAREEWRCHLPTPVCLQDFFDFVLEENYDWILHEENVYDGKLVFKKQSMSKEVMDSSAFKSCIENMEVEMDLLIEGSLKYKALSEIEESSPDAPTTIPTSSKKSTITPSSAEIDSKNSKKAKSPTISTPKNVRQFFKATGTDSDTSITIIEKPFSGYDLGDRRVEVFGKDATFFSKDGTRVCSLYTLIIPMNLEYIILNVVPGNGCNEFWVHRALGDTVKPEVRDICESFRINCKDQVLININKQTYQIPIIIQSAISLEKTTKKEIISKSPSRKLSAATSKIFETRSFHSLFVTWPNGHITETVHENNSPIISHIKQYYINSLPHLDEDMRCISLSGEVLIFKTSGDIEVLKSDGSFIKITKYGKKIATPEAAQYVQSETSSDINKKAKGKEKNKDKSRKTSTKSSKNTLTDDNISIEIKTEYELYIEEFETIDTNGLRQKWINNNPIDIEKLLTRTATDYCLGEIFSRRMDGTNILLNKDGIQIVTFPNNTRIITNYLIEEEEVYPEWTDEEKEYFDMVSCDTMETETIKSKASNSQKSLTESYTNSASGESTKKIEEDEKKIRVENDGYISVQLVFTIEHENFSTITINKTNSKISVDSPNNTIVVVDTNNHYDIALDNATSAKFNGEILDIKYEACPECRSFTTCNIKIKCDETNSTTKLQQNWLKLKDSFCNKIAVNGEGDINILDEPCSELLIHGEDNTFNEDVEVGEEKPVDGKSESSVMSHSKCREIYTAKTVRFFVLRRELTCAELVHRALLEQYKRSCCWQPWCSISQYDTFGDHRSLLSLLTPVHLTQTEKWLMDSKLASKPKYLTYKDLKKDCGKGFYHWMRPYDRFEPKPTKPDNVLPPRLPRAFILRTLEQQWQVSNREHLKGGKELLCAILRYRCIMEADTDTLLNIPVVDLRPEDERRIDDIIQALAHRPEFDDNFTVASDDVSDSKHTKPVREPTLKCSCWSTPVVLPEIFNLSVADYNPQVKLLKAGILPEYRIYEDLKIRLADDVQSRVKATICTKPSPTPEEMSFVGELEEDIIDDPRALEEERESQKKTMEAEEMSPNLKRYWRRLNEEYKEEQFYKYLLQEGSVPPYFRNVLGGSIWWDMNNAAGEAVTSAERRKISCACAAEEGSTKNDTTVTPFS